LTVTAAQAIQNFDNDPNGPPQVVLDSAWNIASLLDGLQPLAAAGALESITFTDSAPPILSLMATKLVTDADVIDRFYYEQSRYV
jgi:hypothetical protein